MPVKHLFTAWGILALFMVVFLALAGIVLTKIEKG